MSINQQYEEQKSDSKEQLMKLSTNILDVLERSSKDNQKEINNQLGDISSEFDQEKEEDRNVSTFDNLEESTEWAKTNKLDRKLV